jgi:hypothetical protein
MSNPEAGSKLVTWISILRFRPDDETYIYTLYQFLQTNILTSTYTGCTSYYILRCFPMQFDKNIALLL